MIKHTNFRLKASKSRKMHEMQMKIIIDNIFLCDYLYFLLCFPLYQFLKFNKIGKEMDVEQTINFCQLFSQVSIENEQQYLNQGIIIQNIFLINSSNKVYRIIMTNSTIIIKNNDQICRDIYVAHFNFHIKFQVISQQINDKTIDIGFKLLSAASFINFFLMDSNNCDILKLWIYFLNKKISQCGFHSNFKPVRKLGKGSFAGVYQVHRFSDNKRLAVKAFSKAACHRTKFGIEAIINQIDMMRRCDHKNVIKIQNVYESDKSIYVILQKLDGDQLSERLRTKQIFKPQQIKQFMIGMLKGLQYLHHLRIIHRDIKPENIMFRCKNSMDPIIVDFGLATNADQQYIFYRCGTVGYVAPEILSIQQDKKIQPQCDIFSLGVIFHFLLTRKNLFSGSKYEEIYIQNKSMQFSLEGSIYDNIAPTILNLLKRMLEKNPANRIKAKQALNHPYFQVKKKMQIKKQPIRKCRKNYMEIQL